jgi:hypothetical protein
MAANRRECQFAHIVGSESTVAWADALTAFITFYHHIICKDRSAKHAVDAMNLAGLPSTPFVAVTPVTVGTIRMRVCHWVAMLSTAPNGQLRRLPDTERNQRSRFSILKKIKSSTKAGIHILTLTTQKRPCNSCVRIRMQLAKSNGERFKTF